MLFQTCMNIFLLLNTKVIKQLLVAVDCHSMKNTMEVNGYQQLWVNDENTYILGWNFPLITLIGTVSWIQEHSDLWTNHYDWFRELDKVKNKKI